MFLWGRSIRSIMCRISSTLSLESEFLGADYQGQERPQAYVLQFLLQRSFKRSKTNTVPISGPVHTRQLSRCLKPLYNHNEEWMEIPVVRRKYDTEVRTFLTDYGMF
jgi:hypothetical protein